MRALLLAALCLAAGAAHAQCANNLPAGSTVTPPQDLPGLTLTSGICIDVPESAQRLTVRLTAADTSRDVDLLVRVGSPFFDTTRENLGSFNVDELFERAHYWSASGTGDEAIVISRSGKQPLRAGSLHLLLLNFDSNPVGFSIGSTVDSPDDFASIDVIFDDTDDGDCDISGWSDSSPRQPIRGNNGTTLGEQRRLAMLEAARLISEQLRPAAAVSLRACWEALEFSSTGGVLAQAGPRFALVDDPGRGLSFPGLDARHVVQFTPAAAHQSGASFCRLLGGSCASPGPDIEATFNLAVDEAANPNQRFDYGLEPITGLGGPSFVAVAMHEVTHGMGFVGLIGLGTGSTPLGGRTVLFGQTYDDAFGRWARIIDTGISAEPPREFLRVSDAERAAALTSDSGLRFAGPRSVPSNNNRLRNNAEPFNLVQLHAPTEVAGQGSYSHLGTLHFNQLMLPSAASPAIRSLGLARDVLYDVGYDPAPKSAPDYPLPLEVQYYDVTRSGHGIDFRRVAGTDDLYFLGFYSYDADGNPEWYTSLGRVVDGVFVPTSNQFGDSLLRFDYSPGPPPLSEVDPSPGYRGEVRIDFVDARRSPVCLASAERRWLNDDTALMTWTLDGETRQWCMQALVDPNTSLDLDLSSVWYRPGDPGWGITVQSFRSGDGDGIAVGVYYPDGNGKGRWGVVQSSRYDPDETYVVRQVQGYCRSPQCESPQGQTFVDIGTLRLDLKPPAEGASRIVLDVTYPGPGGGRFQRIDTEVIPANTPRFRGS